MKSLKAIWNYLYLRKPLKTKTMGTAIKENHKLLLHIEHSKPIEVNDFVSSVNAVGNLFQSFCKESGILRELTEAKLYVSKIEKGSIDIEFCELVTASLIPICEQFNIILNFSEHLTNIFKYYLEKKGEKVKLTVSECKELCKLMNPVVNDNSGKMKFGCVRENNGNVTQNFFFNFDSTTGNAFQNIMRIEEQSLNDAVPLSRIQKNVLLKIFQFRLQGDVDKGNYATIDTILPKQKIRLLFEDESVRTNMLYSKLNPANYAYYVDIEIMTVNEKITAYKVLQLHDIIPIDNSPEM